jgi:hypothetical protein
VRYDRKFSKILITQTIALMPREHTSCTENDLYVNP